VTARVAAGVRLAATREMIAVAEEKVTLPPS
jgi:hypothetical protein